MSTKALKPKGPSPLMIIIAIALLVSGVYTIWNPAGKQPSVQVPVSEFISDVNSGEVSSIKINNSKITYSALEEGKESNKFTYKEAGETSSELLKNVKPEISSKLKIEVIDSSQDKLWMNVFISVVPFLLIIGFLWFMMRGASNSNNQALSFGKSSAKLHDKEKTNTTFKDVAGAKEAKEELVEIVDFLKFPSKYTAMGAKIPKGVMLIGEPGTGKTLLARAVAGEANVPFFAISGSEFVEMFVGVGASRVRDLFKKAKRNAPCIIFIDEIDAVGRKRGSGRGGGHDEREQTLNQILTEMDGFETNTSVIVMAATNRPDVLDDALLRPGRFDRRVVVDSPKQEEREEILIVHSRNKPLAKTVDLKLIARQTPGFSGADLENLMNEAAILATKNGSKEISQEEIYASVEKVQLGPARKSHILKAKEREVTAYHETGHAIVGHVLEDCDPVHKITIISRGMSLGSTWFMPEEDRHLVTKQKFEHEMASLFGGYVAEEMIYGQVSTGPSNDLERASKIARRMVTVYGMSELGPVVFGEHSKESAFGDIYATGSSYSDEKSAEIDKQIDKFVQAGYKLAKEVLKKHEKALHAISKALLEKETLTKEEFTDLFNSEK